MIPSARPIDTGGHPPQAPVGADGNLCPDLEMVLDGSPHVEPHQQDIMGNIPADHQGMVHVPDMGDVQQGQVMRSDGEGGNVVEDGIMDDDAGDHDVQNEDDDDESEEDSEDESDSEAEGDDPEDGIFCYVSRPEGKTSSSHAQERTLGHGFLFAHTCHHVLLLPADCMHTHAVCSS